MIDQLHISNFRGITKLKLSGMKRVNLIVGANNAGKTSLLEAVALAGRPEKLDTVPILLRTKPQGNAKDFERWMVTKNAHHGFIWTKGTAGFDSEIKFNDGCIDEGEESKADDYYEPTQQELDQELSREWKQTSLGNLRLEWEVWGFEKESGYASHAVSVHHRSPEDLIPAFADAVRSPKSERQLERLLNKIDDRIQSVRLDFADQHQFISIDLGLPERIPISQAGQGIYRLTAIISELLGHRPSVCLIDEIENGIHWTALPIVWQGIAEIAEALDIQIFATTHSRECLTAAYEVFQKRATTAEMDFSVIQMMRIKDKIEGRVLNGAHVEAAIENDIELR